jgi:peptidoglycan/LPS O-acetylase OafA/YrhL
MGAMTAVVQAGTGEQAPPPATSRPRERYIDGLRALAAIHVMLSHAFLEVYPREFGVRPHGLLRLVTYEMSISGLGVALFVVLSGYSLGLSVRRNGWRLREGSRAFFRRRARRLVPPYLVALGLSLLLSATLLSEKTGTHWDASVPFSATDVVSHLLLFQDWVGNPYTISHPLWSIAVTWHIYLAFPLMLWAVRRYGLVRTTAVVLGFGSFVAVATRTDAHAVLAVRTMELYGAFLVGLVALELIRRDGLVPWRGREVRPPWTALAIVLGSWSGFVNDFNHAPLYIAMGALMVTVGTGGLKPVRALLESRALVWLGTVSFSLYLVHGPVVHLVWLELLRPLGLGVGEAGTFFALVALAVPASILTAWGFYAAVERRTLSSRSRARRDAEVHAPAPLAVSEAPAYTGIEAIPLP